MAKYSFDYEFFFPNSGEGNKTIGTSQSRVEQALKCLTSPGDYIEFPDGKTCASPEELETVLDEYNHPKSVSNYSLQKINKNHLKIVDYPLTIVAFIILVLGSIYLFAGGIFPLRVICTILGLATSIYVVKKRTVSLAWQKAFNLCIICFSLILGANVMDCFDCFNSYVLKSIVGVVCIFANVVAIIAFAKMSKLVKNGWFSIVFTLIAFICFTYCLYWISRLLGVDVSGFVFVYTDLLGIRYILLAITIGLVGFGLIDISSTERQKHGKHTLVSLLVASFACALACIDDYKSYESYLEYEQNRPHYEDIVYAIEHGHIYKGMSYEQIQEVCGPAESVSRNSDGISSAFYGSDGMGSYKAHLVFSNGRLYDWHY